MREREGEGENGAMEQEEEEGGQEGALLATRLAHAGKERNGVRLPSDRPPDRRRDGRTTKGASGARGNDILLRARPSSVRPSVRGAVGPSTVGWMEVGARFT